MLLLYQMNLTDLQINVKREIAMTVKLVAITIDRELNSIEFRFSTGLSTYTESFIQADDETRKEMHREVRDTIAEFEKRGIKIEYKLGDLAAF